MQEDSNKLLNLIYTCVLEMQKDIRGTQKDVDDLKAEVKGLREEVVDLKAEVKGLREEVDDLKADVKGLREEVDDLKAEVNDLKSRVDKVEADLDDLINEVHDQKTEIMNKMSSLESKLKTYINDGLDDLKLVIKYEIDNLQFKVIRPKTICIAEEKEEYNV